MAAHTGHLHQAAQKKRRGVQMTNSPSFERVEVAAAKAEVSSSTARARAASGDVPAIRRGKLLLIDSAALMRLYAPRPVTPNAGKAK